MSHKNGHEGGMGTGPRIFINYRRSDAQGWAGRTYDRLEAEYGAGNVFMDVDTIKAGDYFADVLRGEVAKCNIFLALIANNWISDRLFNKDDFVRIEIETAIREKKIQLIPVLLGSAELPSHDKIPVEIHDILTRNAVRLRHESFSRDIDALMDKMTKYFDEIKEAEERLKAEAERNEREAVTLTVVNSTSDKVHFWADANNRDVDLYLSPAEVRIVKTSAGTSEYNARASRKLRRPARQSQRLAWPRSKTLISGKKYTVSIKSGFFGLIIEFN